jgi:hypothetical protein
MTENEEPTLPKLRKEKDDARLTISNTDKEEPTRTKLRRDKELPKLKKSNTDTEPPKRPAPTKEMLDPRRE